MKTKSAKVKSAPKKAKPTHAVAQAPAKAETQIPPKKVKADKGKRVSLNPQPVIDKKAEALKALGVKLTYTGRQWHAGDKTFTSLEMSKYSVDEFAKLFAAK